MSARLILLGATTAEYSLCGTDTLGRHPENTIQVLDRIVSKEHATITQEGPQRFVLRDSGSLNGTFVNGQKCSEQLLKTGDQISMGSTTFRFEAFPEQASVTVPVPPPIGRTTNAAAANSNASASASANGIAPVGET